jgi:7-carboxy-7-deazaguanine synthase
MRITEIYKSIQGESTWAGMPCIFVRTNRCDLRCTWCDSAFTFTGGVEMSVEAILGEVERLGPGLVEITGGEPMIQTETPELCRRFLALGYEVLIETSGSMAVDMLDPRVKKIVDVKCPGSGEAAKNLAGIEKTLTANDEIKFVIATRADFDWALAWIRERGMENDSRFLFAPVWESCKPAMLAEWLLQSGLDARLNLQQHKVLWGDVPGR